MGFTKVTTRITNIDASEKNYEAKFLVDTGATDSLVPSDELDKIGVRKQGTVCYELADGSMKEYSYGIARIQLMGELTAGRVIFGEEGSEPLLGVTVLESLGFMVDPVNRTLKRLPALRLKRAA